MAVQTANIAWNAPVFGEEEIIEAWQDFISTFCRNIQRKMLWHEPVEDLEQEANMVLLRLIRTGAYDSTRNAGFKTFFINCLHNRFRRLALTAAKYRSRVQTLPELEFPTKESDVDVVDLIEVLRAKLPELTRRMLDARLSEGNRVKLAKLCDELNCSYNQTRKLSIELMRTYRELTV